MKTIILFIACTIACGAWAQSVHQFTGQGLPQSYDPATARQDQGIRAWSNNFCSVQLQYLQQQGSIPSDWAFANPDVAVSPNTAGPMDGKSITITCDFQNQANFDGKTGGAIQLTAYSGTVRSDESGLYFEYRD
jgi:hypothetical protein